LKAGPQLFVHRCQLAQQPRHFGGVTGHQRVLQGTDDLRLLIGDSGGLVLADEFQAGGRIGQAAGTDPDREPGKVIVLPAL
jgi:hypothetical protein